MVRVARVVCDMGCVWCGWCGVRSWVGPQAGGVPSSDIPILCYNCGVVVPVGDELSNLNDIARAGMRKSDRLVEQLLKGVIGLAAIANGFHVCWVVMPPNLVR